MLLELKNVSKRYQTPANADALTVLSEINLQLSEGDSIGIVGPSGCGKSTLLNILGTLDRPSSGQVLFEGREIQSLDSRELAVLRNRRIGFVFQLHHLLPQCTILENVLLPTLTDPAVLQTEETLLRVEKLLERVGLKQRQSHRPGQLSGGERQRVAVVRALINRPGLLLADEPTGSLDRSSAENLGKLLVELNKEERVSLVVVTHSEDLARQMARSFELRDGRLLPSKG